MQKGNPLEDKFTGLGESKEMLSFLKAASTGTKQMLINKIKLVFIGDGGAGKTSLIKSFERDAKLLPGNNMCFIVEIYNPKGNLNQFIQHVQLRQVQNQFSIWKTNSNTKCGTLQANQSTAPFIRFVFGQYNHTYIIP